MPSSTRPFAAILAATLLLTPSSVTFLTPFALLVQHSSQQSNYSAQQAAKDHHPDDEIVVIEIQVLLTRSYGAVITMPTSSRSGCPIGYQLALPVSGKTST